MNSKQYFCNEEIIYTMGTSLAHIENVYFDYSKYVSSKLTLRVSEYKLQHLHVVLYLGEPEYHIEYYHFVEKYGRNDWDDIIRKVNVINPEVRLI